MASSLLVVAALSLNAADIPRKSTPKSGEQCGGKAELPLETLSGCTEPIPAGVVDLRGIWIGDIGTTGLQSTERIEQCGRRVIISGPTLNGHSFIHDFPVADETLANGVDDWFAGAFPECKSFCAYAKINSTCLEIYADPQCTEQPPISQVSLAARRCKKPDGTMEFFNQQLFNRLGTTVTFNKGTEADAMAASDTSAERAGRLANLRRALPIFIVIIVLCCCGCCGTCCYCKRKRKACFGPGGCCEQPERKEAGGEI